jgi:glycosyltransferase involved in cell wall biosynthesis
MKYSICTTVYNSEDVVNQFLSKFVNTEHEIVILNGGSTDSTGKLLANYHDRIKIINMKCTRGMGKKLAIENASGDNVILIDFDIEISNLKEIIDTYEQNYEEKKIIAIKLKGSTCSPNIFAGAREIFTHIDAWSDINCFEDIYFEKICDSLCIIKSVDLVTDYNCLKIRHVGPGRESRYENNLFKKASRRIRCATDAIFVSDFNFNGLMKYYRITGLRKLYVGLPEYIIARFLSHFVKVKKLNDKIRELKNRA